MSWKEKWKKKWKYISNRVQVLGVLCLAALSVSGAVQLAAAKTGTDALFTTGCLTLLAGAALAASFGFWVVRPYREHEKVEKRFLAGYMFSGEDLERAVLTPMTREQMEMMEKIIRSPQLMDLNKRQAQYLALQNQINPHFLYNTLDSIIWMAEGKKNEEVVLMTASLARLLRQSISNEDEVVPIANEVEYARGYLTIQKMRYKDKLEFQIAVDSSILYIPLIKLVLQPIIENAIYHGLKYKESKGLLIVKGFMKDGNAVLQVIDDGVGMDEETLAHIYDKHKVNYHSNGVGVYNVQKRLKLYYGEDYGITYTSELGKGTTATITIPGRQEGQI